MGQAPSRPFLGRNELPPLVLESLCSWEDRLGLTDYKSRLDEFVETANTYTCRLVSSAIQGSPQPYLLRLQLISKSVPCYFAKAVCRHKLVVGHAQMIYPREAGIIFVPVVGCSVTIQENCDEPVVVGHLVEEAESSFLDLFLAAEVEPSKVDSKKRAAVLLYDAASMQQDFDVVSRCYQMANVVLLKGGVPALASQLRASVKACGNHTFNLQEYSYNPQYSSDDGYTSKADTYDITSLLVKGDLIGAAHRGHVDLERQEQPARILGRFAEQDMSKPAEALPLEMQVARHNYAEQPDMLTFAFGMGLVTEELVLQACYGQLKEFEPDVDMTAGGQGQPAGASHKYNLQDLFGVDELPGVHTAPVVLLMIKPALTKLNRWSKESKAFRAAVERLTSGMDWLVNFLLNSTMALDRHAWSCWVKLVHYLVLPSSQESYEELARMVEEWLMPSMSSESRKTALQALRQFCQKAVGAGGGMSTFSLTAWPTQPTLSLELFCKGLAAKEASRPPAREMANLLAQAIDAVADPHSEGEGMMQQLAELRVWRQDPRKSLYDALYQHGISLLELVYKPDPSPRHVLIDMFRLLSWYLTDPAECGSSRHGIPLVIAPVTTSEGDLTRWSLSLKLAAAELFRRETCQRNIQLPEPFFPKSIFPPLPDFAAEACNVPADKLHTVPEVAGEPPVCTALSHPAAEARVLVHHNLEERKLVEGLPTLKLDIERGVSRCVAAVAKEALADALEEAVEAEAFGDAAAGGGNTRPSTNTQGACELMKEAMRAQSLPTLATTVVPTKGTFGQKLGARLAQKLEVLFPGVIRRHKGLVAHVVETQVKPAIHELANNMALKSLRSDITPQEQSGLRDNMAGVLLMGSAAAEPTNGGTANVPAASKTTGDAVWQAALHAADEVAQQVQECLQESPEEGDVAVLVEVNTFKRLRNAYHNLVRKLSNATGLKGEQPMVM